MKKQDNLKNKRKKTSFFMVILIFSIFILLLLYEVIITKQKYNIISLNSKIGETKKIQEELEMDKSQLLSRSRLRSIAIDKIKMIEVKNIDESIKNQVSE